jgi:hypothetical protein
MSYCKLHNIQFGWTCGICEEEWLYMGRTHLLDAFRAGVKSKPYPCHDVQRKAAYEHGVETKRNYTRPSTTKPVQMRSWLPEPELEIKLKSNRDGSSRRILKRFKERHSTR